MRWHSFFNRSNITLPILLIVAAGCGNNSNSTNASPPSDTNASTSDPSSISTGNPADNTTDNVFSAIEQALSPQQEVPFSNAFDDVRLTEVSGVQRSLLIDGVYYVHNDSGSEPFVYVSDASGQILGSLNIAAADSVDWEGLAGAQRDGMPVLIVADIGDNDRQRSDLSLLVIEEPPLSELEPGFELTMTADRIALSYGDGLPYDAEAVYIDGDNDTVVVLTKNSQDTSAQSIWKGSLSSGLTDTGLVLQFSGLISLPSANLVNAITDVDIHPNGREIAVLTYGSVPLLEGRVHLWTARVGEGTSDALLRPADETVVVPIVGANVQAEGISYNGDGNLLLVGAEGVTRSALTVVDR